MVTYTCDYCGTAGRGINVGIRAYTPNNWWTSRPPSGWHMNGHAAKEDTPKRYVDSMAVKILHACSRDCRTALQQEGHRELEWFDNTEVQAVVGRNQALAREVRRARENQGG